MKRSAADIAAAGGHVETRQLPRRGHVWPLQDVELFAATVTAWLAGQQLPDALVPYLGFQVIHADGSTSK